MLAFDFVPRPIRAQGLRDSTSGSSPSGYVGVGAHVGAFGSSSYDIERIATGLALRQQSISNQATAPIRASFSGVSTFGVRFMNSLAAELEIGRSRVHFKTTFENQPDNTDEFKPENMVVTTFLVKGLFDAPR